ncbi:MAG: hypothetical protein ACE148_05580 [Vicinamibacterales bacterium]
MASSPLSRQVRRALRGSRAAPLQGLDARRLAVFGAVFTVTWNIVAALPLVASRAPSGRPPTAGEKADEQFPAHPSPGRVEVLRSIRGVPVEIVGAYEAPAAFEQVRSGQYFVFDRRAQSIWGIDRTLTGTWKIVSIGQERGRIYQPLAFASEPGGNFVVLDQPGGGQRLQVFAAGGAPLGGFDLGSRETQAMVVDGLVLNAIGFLHFDGRKILASRVTDGTLFTEFTLAGATARHFGDLRRTGQEHDPVVHRALNTGIPLADPTGGYYFVFQTGVPQFRKYDAGGQIVFERHVEGREMNAVVSKLPTTWPKRRGKSGEEIPIVPPVIRAAAVDPGGNLWLSLTVPYTYVYDSNGDKVRTIQFRAAGTIAPTSLLWRRQTDTTSIFASPRRLLVTPGCFEFDPG